jgi:hypothetical protein
MIEQKQDQDDRQRYAQQPQENETHRCIPFIRVNRQQAAGRFVPETAEAKFAVAKCARMSAPYRPLVR